MVHEIKRADWLRVFPLDWMHNKDPKLLSNDFTIGSMGQINSQGKGPLKSANLSGINIQVPQMEASSPM